ncbi:MAG: GNAT family N-acetyltransferase [Bacteroidetes bacterium]|nr:GNAT family N-acetyltransferase [Bacteroidota bacterium]
MLDTDRLILREFNITDAEFILTLLNTPDWLKYIGDKNVRTLENAVNYLEKGPIKSYKENGFGLWLTLLKNNSVPIGMCGLVKRDSLKDIEIGFALLPEYSKMGYGYEIAYATINYAIHVLRIDKVVAITDSNNIPSIILLNKLGLQFERTLNLSENDTVLLFSSLKAESERLKIDELTASFFDLFSNKDGRVPNVKDIKSIFIPEGILVSNTEDTPAIYDLDSFIKPREEILTNGTLTNFCEREISHNTEIFGNVAQRFSLYEKTGELNGEHFEIRGMKTIQFVKVNGKWKMSAAAWSDEK